VVASVKKECKMEQIRGEPLIFIEPMSNIARAPSRSFRNMILKTRTIDGMSFSFSNEREFECIYHTIFKVESWRFIAHTPAPFILDCGAHIGISVLYFKKRYPRAKIVAFEPNPTTFKLLELNVRQNNVHDVELVNAALSMSPGEIDFYICEETADPSTWAWGNSGIKGTSYDPSTHKTIRVPTVQLSSFINQAVDFIKIDVEDMEEIVLEEIAEKLCFVEQLAIEVQCRDAHEFGSLHNILSILSRGGFEYFITQGNKLIRVGQLKEPGTFNLEIIAHRRSRALWWRMHVIRNMNRLHRLMTGNVRYPSLPA
jgi:FkbM family methyltransferase